MVWYLPATWFEDLGTARRVSVYSYDNQKLDISAKRNWVYSVSCNVIGPNGELSSESYSEYTISPWIPDTNRPLMTEMRRKLRNNIREKYPKPELVNSL